MGVAWVSAQGQVQAHLGLFPVLVFGAELHQPSSLPSALRGILLSQWFPHSSPLDRHKGHFIDLHNPRTALITGFWAHVQESPSLCPQNKALLWH